MQPICAICGQKIAPAEDSEEHILPGAIGGRQTVRGLLHDVCNHRSGQTWDAALEKQLRPLALHFGVKRQRGRTLRMAITTTAGENFLLNSGGQLEMSRPEIKRTPTPNGETIQVKAGSIAVVREVLESIKRKYPKVDVESALAGAEVQRTYAQGVVKIDLEFGGPVSGRSLVKSALALAHDASLPIDRCGDALAYLREVDAEPCFGYYYADDLIDCRPPATPLHCVAIDANPSTGLILGYVEYFGIHRAVVCLGRGYAGKRMKASYALDPRTGDTLDVAVRLDFGAADVRDIYDYKRDDIEKRQEAFGAVFGPALSAHRSAERDRVARDSLNFAWANCGGVPDQPLTAEHLARLKELFADRATPWWKHVTGLDEPAARQLALIHISQVLAATLDVLPVEPRNDERH
ncbi:HNH endonuclease [Rhodoblastus acidophilus]|uniref:HNH endonuclease n=1 Tax=Rhodoblastus acidophilus TaxID=1074 RepID=A0A212QMJ6_RHOAC|nr:HNH endonuclease [Rhodoblastus acidophilus]PPQ38873.1 HNH endonuclease [Rhodoblastus acidophilus]RAI18025.1 HNH endonuclease [Rhodoblastus acidophilus]SNB60620.1 HNH endonuclease [Rhodoblastus acidophilus]